MKKELYRIPKINYALYIKPSGVNIQALNRQKRKIFENKIKNLHSLESDQLEFKKEVSKIFLENARNEKTSQVGSEMMQILDREGNVCVRLYKKEEKGFQKFEEPLVLPGYSVKWFYYTIYKIS